MVFAIVPNTVLAANDAASDGFETDEFITEENEESGVTGEIDDYDIANITMLENSVGFEVSYSASDNCNIAVEFSDEISGDVFYKTNEEIFATENKITIEYDTRTLPKYYIIAAVLYNENGILSDTYNYYEGTQAFEKFMNTTINDSEFSDNIIIDYGQSDAGKENFAVVSNDVKVIEVETISSVDICEPSEDETAELFSLGNTNDDSYTFDKSDETVKNSVEKIKPGDKVLILPKNDVSEIRTFIAGDIENSVDLYSDDGTEGSVTIQNDSETEFESEDFFDFIRIEETIEFDASNLVLDNSEINSDVEVVEEDVELFETAGTDGVQKIDKTIKTITKKLGSGGSITDKVSVLGEVYIFAYYAKNWASLPKLKTIQVTAIAKMDFINDFKFSLSKNASYSKDLFSASVPIYSAGVLTVAIPVTGKLSCSASATVTANTTQKAGICLIATYKDKKLNFKKSQNEFTKGYNVKVKGNITVKLGVETGLSVQVGLSKAAARMKLTGECGVKLVGTPTFLENSSKVTHNCNFCLGGTLSIYYGLFQATLEGKVKGGNWTKLAGTPKTSENTVKLTSFYASLRRSKWYFGTGACKNKSYLVTINAKKSSGKALSGVTVKDGSTTLGTTNSKGVLNKKLKVGNHTIKCSKSGYITKSINIKISSSTVSKTVKLSKKGGANETYYTMDDLISLTDNELAEFLSDSEVVANTIFRIENAEDFKKLYEFVNQRGCATDNVRFVLNNAEGTIDLTGIEWNPIGTAENPFNGELDGNKFTIIGLSVNRDNDYSGLFGNISNAKIFDLGIVDASVKGKNNIGILTGYAGNGSEIYDCYTLGTVSGTNNVGGLVGYLDKSSIINSYNRADVYAEDNAGGLAGAFIHTNISGQISNAYNTGAVTSESRTGGIAGIIEQQEETTKEDTEAEPEVNIVGIQYSYFLNNVESAVGNSAEYTGNSVAYSVTEEQAKGKESLETISNEDNYALVYSMLDALRICHEIVDNFIRE